MLSGLFHVAEHIPRSFSTLAIEATCAVDGSALGRGLSKSVASSRRAQPDTRVYSHVASAVNAVWNRYVTRVWWQPPARWREEVLRHDGPPYVVIVRDNARMIYDPTQRMFSTNEAIAVQSRSQLVPPPSGIFDLPTIENRLSEFPLIRPPLPAKAWEFETIAERESFQGRVMRRVRATRRVETSHDARSMRTGFWPGVDVYECVVDDALRVIRRLTGFVDGEAAGIFTIDHLEVDAVFSAELFAFTPPADSSIQRIERTT